MVVASVGVVDAAELFHAATDEGGAETEEEDAGERVADEAEAAEDGAGEKVGAGGVVGSHRL